jgi:hypothetical protein
MSLINRTTPIHRLHMLFPGNYTLVGSKCLTTFIHMRYTSVSHMFTPRLSKTSTRPHPRPSLAIVAMRSSTSGNIASFDAGCSELSIRISTAVGDKVEVRGGGRGWSFETTEGVGFTWSQPHISNPLHPRHTRG